MTQPMIEWLLKYRVVSGEPAGETARVWNAILAMEFPIADLYTTGFDVRATQGTLVLYVAKAVSTQSGGQCEFLIIECLAPTVEAQDPGWEPGLSQLNSLLGRAASRDKKRKFGAIAAGWVVKFFEWDREAECVVNLEPHDGVLFIDFECQSVTNWLQHFRDNHDTPAGRSL